MHVSLTPNTSYAQSMFTRTNLSIWINPVGFQIVKVLFKWRLIHIFIYMCITIILNKTSVSVHSEPEKTSAIIVIFAFDT